MALACNETITMRHDVLRAIFPGLPLDLRGSPYLASEEELIAAGLVWRPSPPKIQGSQIDQQIQSWSKD